MNDTEITNPGNAELGTSVELVSLNTSSDIAFDMRGYQLQITVNSINATRTDAGNQFIQELMNDCPVQNGIYLTELSSITPGSAPRAKDSKSQVKSMSGQNTKTTTTV